MHSLPMFPLNAKKVQVCETMSGRFTVEIKDCKKVLRQLLATYPVSWHTSKISNQLLNVLETEEESRFRLTVF